MGPSMGWMNHGATGLDPMERAVNLHEGILGESPKVLMTPQDKASFSSRTGAVAVDMESGAIAAVASDGEDPLYRYPCCLRCLELRSSFHGP